MRSRPGAPLCRLPGLAGVTFGAGWELVLTGPDENYLQLWIGVF